MNDYIETTARLSEVETGQGGAYESLETEGQDVTRSSANCEDWASGYDTGELVTVLMYLRNMWLSRDGEQGTFDLSARAWETTLDIAEAYGWDACGTIHDDIDDWEGSYLLNNDQTVVEQDAINIADALARSVSDRFQKLVGTDLEFVSKNEGSANFVEGVISYVRRGSFYIG
jgi:hypothetical protein